MINLITSSTTDPSTFFIVNIIFVSGCVYFIKISKDMCR